MHTTLGARILTYKKKGDHNQEKENQVRPRGLTV